jgi:hypothetical protein
MLVSFTPEFADRLRADLQIKGQQVHNPHGGGNTYELERALGEDMLLVSVGWANSYYQQSGTYTDEWGITWKPIEYTTPYGVGSYTEPTGHPLEDDEAVFSYTGPDPNRPELYADAERVIRDFKDEYWIVGVTVTTIFECAWALRGYERLLSDFVLNPDLAEHLLEIPYRYHLTAAKKLVEMGVDMIWVGDDVGAQTRMLISPNHWRRYLKPRMANFIAELKAINPQVKVAYHSDGNIYSIIPRIDRDRPGCAQSNPTRQHGPGDVEKGVREQAVFLGLHRRAANSTIRHAGPGQGRSAQAPENDRGERRSDPRPNASRAAGYPDGQLLGDGQHGYTDPLRRSITYSTGLISHPPACTCIRVLFPGQ